ncbi:MAG: DNA polymerase I [Candidatus Scalindua sp. AMX11]|nr:MAG: DNA polymerase I [Candidatus Scalindua sp.]NOG83229.1 DNA polymerase I [Planctomycetota bacterium]RZV77591.1 MAG: DNA polymerase I [Candidatus Scalindua sp. SCAELEC01]TDE63515.1 MAG: DNA polymerase I [Candidatus Scalindua sp. AMX11]GJQ58661.1 MAG: DNA polymerase [Candidatus Scalindua sp.]
MCQKIIIIDGSSYIFRAFYAIKSSLSNSKGLPTNAIFGFARMLLKVVRDENPDYVAVVFDSEKKTSRHEYFPEYKANRAKMPEDLTPQIPYIHDLVKSFNMRVVCVDGIEADDIIGTLAVQSRQKGLEVIIVSGDKDMMQLVGNGITMLDTMKEKRIGPKEVQEKLGVTPEKVVEMMGLMGDTSDNIPGVPGIGPKTALELINTYGDIENTLANAQEVKKKSIREKLSQFEDQARLSRRLVTIVTDLDLDCDPTNFQVREMDNDAVVRILKELEFTALLKELTTSPKSVEKAEKSYHTVLEKQDFDTLLKSLKKSGSFAIDLETTSKHPMLAKIVGISLSFKPHEAYYIPVAHDYAGCPIQLDFDLVLERLKPLLEDPAIHKYGQNIKYEKIVLQNAGINLQGMAFDTMIASYLLDPNKRNHNLDDISLEYLEHRMITYKEVTGTGQKEIGFHQVEIPRASEYSCEDADVTFLLTKKLAPMIKAEEGLEELLQTVEMPLLEVLAEMEINGVGIDVNLLREMSRTLEKELEDNSKRIYHIAGEEFNINSPKQLAIILFEKLKLPTSKKTKTGYSTDEGVLERLAYRHELPAEVLNYRKLKKLKSTYVDALPALVNRDTGRVHTSFNQTVAATGRLSSTEPNLQNIPTQTEAGMVIRKAFIPDDGNLILSADYSQIELRILAHLSGDEILMESFRQGEDIHTRTASEVFHLNLEAVTPEMRKMAKAVNFGIIYGISAFGLSNGIGVSQKEAKEFIDNYFNLYKKVKQYINESIEKAHADGSVSTMLGRIRRIPELISPNKNLREFGERMAVNSPIQGSAADIIKLAMITIFREMKKEELKSKMIIQVHDELVFEVPVSEKEVMETLVRSGMEQAYPLQVPLTVDLRFGENWNEAH